MKTKHSGLGDQYSQSNLIHSIVEEAKICLLSTAQPSFSPILGNPQEKENQGATYQSLNLIASKESCPPLLNTDSNSLSHSHSGASQISILGTTDYTLKYQRIWISYNVAYKNRIASTESADWAAQPEDERLYYTKIYGQSIQKKTILRSHTLSWRTDMNTPKTKLIGAKDRISTIRTSKAS